MYFCVQPLPLQSRNQYSYELGFGTNGYVLVFSNDKHIYKQNSSRRYVIMTSYYVKSGKSIFGYGQHVMIRMLDCALLITESDVCLTIQAPVTQWLNVLEEITLEINFVKTTRRLCYLLL